MMILYAISYAHPSHGLRYLCMTTDTLKVPSWTYDTPKLYRTEAGAQAAIRHLPPYAQGDCWVTRMVLREEADV